MAAPGLIRRLTDGGFHSGPALARDLGISRTAVWKQIERLQQLWELEIERHPRKGYRLTQPLDLLDASALRQALGNHSLDSLEIHDELDSTNAHLMARALCGDRGVCACLAERQTAGRGRRGRSWVSPFAANLYLSLLWHSSRPPQRLAGISLALGVVIARLLHQLGFPTVGLKWPNDLITPRGKLGGLLIQLNAEGQGPSSLVIGLGLNIHMPAGMAKQIDQPWTDLATLGPHPSRSTLAGQLIGVMLDALHQYEQQGLAPFLADWTRLDLLHGQPVRLIRGDEQVIEGINAGISADGALLLRTAAGIRPQHSGEVSLRAG
jgi:BirA family biotin operon repressor/biotin-[acetyl-CoA-carboxylase] ligase